MGFRRQLIAYQNYIIQKAASEEITFRQLAPLSAPLQASTATNDIHLNIKPGQKCFKEEGFLIIKKKNAESSTNIVESAEALETMHTMEDECSRTSNNSTSELTHQGSLDKKNSDPKITENHAYSQSAQLEDEKVDTYSHHMAHSLAFRLIPLDPLPPPQALVVVDGANVALHHGNHKTRSPYGKAM